MRRSDHLSARDIPSLAAYGRHRRQHGRDELFLPTDDCQDIPAHTVTVRPGLMTRPRASIRSPCAGERKFTLYSIVKTEAPAGISVMAAYPHATSTIAVRTAAARKP